MVFLFIIITSFVAWLLYITFEPKIDVVRQPKKRVVLLWYNIWIEGYPTAKRGYKKLFYLK